LGCDAVFIPLSTEIYPSPENESTTIQLGFLDTVCEGLYRPGHFSGVATVVIKLFNIIRPDRVYFGQKDLQQVAVIRQLINDLSYNIDLILVPTVRENDGLAFSSRNVRIPTENRKSAVLFYQSLIHAKNQFLSGTPIPDIRDHIKNSFLDHTECILEYIEFVDPLNFRTITTPKINSVVGICIAGYIRNIRLIDNLLINT
jgi:pantoate--beta-alanine ligase